MPELPETETTISQLKKKVLKRTLIDVWTDSRNLIKKPRDYQKFKKEIKGQQIQKIWRRGKNILFDLSGQKTLLIHQKLTGHLLIGNWKRENARPFRPVKQGDWGNWKPLRTGPLREKINTYIHLMFWLSGGLMLALSDLRKFAKIELWDKKELENSKEFNSLGPEPLDKNFTFEKFYEILKRKEKGKTKQVLTDQTVIAGIGNIYSDEILWQAKIHPFKDISKLNQGELKKIFQAIKEILSRAIELGGESISDYRTLTGERGGFDKARKVYRKEGEECSRCGTIIERIKISGRSAHFCPQCQK